jgi:hypothetical protein
MEEKMQNPQFPTARKTGLVVQEMPDELLVYDTENNKAHCLNRTAAFVFKSCDGGKSAADIASLYSLESGNKMSEDMVWLAIDQLNENDLLEQQVKSLFAGQSRRDVIKKIGFASVVALPVIASLVAPKNAIAAASCACANPAACITQTTCASQTNCAPGGFCQP